MEPKEIYRTLIRLRILIDASKAPIDSGDAARRLEERGLSVRPASVQRVLREFEEEGYLASKGPHNGLPKMYAITETGRLRAREAKKRIQELIEMIFG